MRFLPPAASLLGAFCLAGMALTASAGVVGSCSNCHTMHNSQAGAAVVETTGAGWSAGGVLTGGSGHAPQEYLLKSDCLGCHTSLTDATIVVIGGQKIPIVFNTIPPTKPLAGGNFYWVSLGGGDAKGHNVRGISAADASLDAAPGSVGCADSCHTSLTLTDAQTDGHRHNGCRGCHNSVRHHGTAVAGQPVTAAGGWYRFLSAPEDHDALGGAGVWGIEGDDWEQNASSISHNTYYGGDGTDNQSPESITKFCAGCHYAFHSPGFPTTNFGIDNGGGANPWLRHPTDVALPNSGEYTAYTTYDPVVPVARPEQANLDTMHNSDAVRPGTDMVTCLSCHRAHGSPYDDMLRWDYTTMNAGNGGAASGTGCFKCHSTKD